MIWSRRSRSKRKLIPYIREVKVVYIPKYERHEYCRKEFAAMESLEKKRFCLINGQEISEYGMIIPVILRGEKEDLPQRITNNIHYADFSRWTTASEKIKDDNDSIKEVEKIAKYIYKLYKYIEDYSDDIFHECESFRLPDNVPAWRDSQMLQPFPGSWKTMDGV